MTWKIKDYKLKIKDSLNSSTAVGIQKSSIFNFEFSINFRLQIKNS